MEEIVFEDENLEVYYHQGKSNFVVMTFNEMGTSPGKGAWGGGALRKNGFSYLGFVSKQPNWFPSSSMESAKASLHSTLEKYRTKVMYGHSQGGYAAIRYASLYNAKSVLSFCPQFSIHPDSMSGKDNRFSRYYQSTDNHREIYQADVGEDCQTHIFYDPKDELDKLNFLHIKETISSVREIQMFGTGHQSVRAIANSDAVGKILNAAVADDLHEIFRTLRSSKRMWPARGVFLARDIAIRNRDSAIRLIERYQGQITSDVVPGLAGNLFLAGAYKYLSDNVERFLLNASPGVKIVLLKSLIAADKLELAKSYGNTWLWQDDDVNTSIQNLVDEISEATAAKTKSSKPDLDEVIFGEGWHPAEKWGRWGSSERSRIYIKPSKERGLVQSITIPLSSISPSKQVIKARYYINNSWVSSDISEGSLTINNNGLNTVIDISVSAVFSPYHLKINRDRRLMGAKIPSTDKWIFRTE